MVNGEVIREARTRAGISQAKLAELVGVSEPTVYRWESGRTRRIDYSVAQRLAEALGVMACELIHRQDATRIAESAPENGEARPHKRANAGAGPVARGA